MRVYTSTYNCSRPDRLDITAKGQDPIGKLFAPDWRLVNDCKKGNISYREYTDRYYEQMRASYRAHRPAWEQLLSRDSVTLVCFCRPGELCHRLLLANILTKLGATYAGEIPYK